MKGRVFTHPSVCNYHTSGHPEAPWRVFRTADHLRALGYALEAPTVTATAADALRVHTPAHWDALAGGLFQDPDTPFHDGIADIALTSVAGCLSAAQSAIDGTPAFSLMRPPGHHASAEGISGFCYLNNVAIACDRLSSAGRKVAILDIDVHHGDGTQAIALTRPDWLFVSLHQAPLFPGTGWRSERNCRNIPLPAGTEETAYLASLASALGAIRAWKPDVLAVSAGFDTHKDCPIAGMALEATSYAAIGRAIAAEGWPRFATLEGGYADALPGCIAHFLSGFFS